MSSVMGAVSKETPLRAFSCPCGGTPAAYVMLAPFAGADVTSAPSAASPCACCGPSMRRYIFVQRVRAIGHSFSNRNAYGSRLPPVRISSLTGGSSMIPVSSSFSQ